MAREHLVDFFRDLAAARGEFLVHDDGYRIRRRSYEAVAAAAEAFAARIQAAGLVKGDAALLWSENRPEWIVAFWGCVLAGVVVVPIDHRSSPAFAARVAGIVKPRLVLEGEDVHEGGHPFEGLAGIGTWQLAEVEWGVVRRPAPVPHARNDVAEIIFTSGATAEPKGVVITHGNLLANIVPIEREILKYRGWGRPFFPLRFLNLLPLSHLFGQAMATFIPPLLPGTVVFMRGHNPADVVRRVRENRISVIVCVPKILEVLRDYAVRVLGAAARPDEMGGAIPLRVAGRWWRHRRVHRALGLKAWAFVVGGAPLEASLEEYWSRLGFLIIQGYGLTETAPVVSLNHPFAARRGSVGKAIGGIEVRIAEDGEILVRGENVSPGYFGDEGETTAAFEDGWLRTGDVGEMDEQGRLFVRGRKKEMIVTPEGLNVFPEDVERVLDAQPGVRESAVVGLGPPGEERVHAVIVVEEGVDIEKVVRAANGRLGEAQRIRSVSTWPGPELPRTEGTRKLRRRAVREWAQTGRPPERPRAAAESVETIIGRLAGGRPVSGQTTLEELGLSSLDRVELAVALEQQLATTVDDTMLAGSTTLGQVQALAEAPAVAGRDTRGADEWEMPAWNRSPAARVFRRASLAGWVLPLARLFVRLDVQGLDNLRGVREPVVFAANHQSHLDTPAILTALPAGHRNRIAVAMAKEFFNAHFHPEGQTLRRRLWHRLLYVLASLFFNAFPLPQREAGTRRALRYVGELLGDGWSVLIYPEGERTESGAIGRFRPGIGMIAARLRVPVVPVRLEGLDKVLHRRRRMPRSGRVRVIFGAPMMLTGDDHAALAGLVERAVRSL